MFRDYGSSEVSNDAVAHHNFTHLAVTSADEAVAPDVAPGQDAPLDDVLPTAGYTEAPDEPSTAPGDSTHLPPTVPPVIEGGADADGEDDGEPFERSDTRYHLSRDRVTLIESSTVVEGTTETRLRAYDANGKPVSPRVQGYKLEGQDYATGMTFSVTERDHTGRPVRVTGTPEDTSEHAIVHLGGGAPNPLTGTEITFSYTAEGLLDSHTQTEHYAQGVRVVHEQTFYDETGGRAGTVRRTATEVDPESGEPKVVVDRLTVYREVARGEQTVTYTRFEDGLVPVSLEQELHDPVRPGVVQYQAVPYRRDQMPFVLARDPDLMQLGRLLPDGSLDIERVVALPTWIAAERADAIASHAALLVSVGSENPFRGLAETTTIIDRMTAFHIIDGATDDSEVYTFINNMNNGTYTVLQPLTAEPDFVYEMQWRLGSSSQRMTDLQKLAVFAAFHPAATRLADHRPTRTEQHADAQIALGLKRLLATLSSDMRASVQRHVGVLDANVLRWSEYLFGGNR